MRRKNHNKPLETSNYLLNISDMFMGLLFLFIILLVYYASQANETHKRLTDVRETRTALLLDLRNRLGPSNIEVEFDDINGVLRLPDGTVSFILGSSEFDSQSSITNVRLLSDALSKVLPCYTWNSNEADCGQVLHYLEAVFIEGHTDSTGSTSRNWSLSVDRGLAAFQEIMAKNPELEQLTNQQGKPIFSVSGYGEGRPLANHHDLADSTFNRMNRRIDLRFIMTPPENIILENRQFKLVEESR